MALAVRTPEIALAAAGEDVSVIDLDEVMLALRQAIFSGFSSAVIDADHLLCKLL
jgi:hypothetical protein